MSTKQQGIGFGLVGVAGYIAVRHLRAIKAVSGHLVAALDPADSVGVLDSYFPDARFFVEFERFDRYIDKLRRQGEAVGYVSICSPNYLHDAHVRFALRSGSDAICEKPLVLNPWNLDGLSDIQRHTGRRINTILQLRLHPVITALRDKIMSAKDKKIFDVDLTYITSRGHWYFASWKGDEQKSGGIATNIGVHFFDMLHFLFGNVRQSLVHHRAADSAAGYLEYEKARVRWYLSIDRNDLPGNMPEGQLTFRSITIDGEEIEFSGGFTDLHTVSYQGILNGNGFSLDDVRSSIETVSHIRTAALKANAGDQHPLLQKRGR